MIRPACLDRIFALSPWPSQALQQGRGTKTEVSAFDGAKTVMIVDRQGDRLTIEAPAKVNLHLEIHGKREDGYHEIETLLVTVSLYDTLEFREVPDGTDFHCSEPSVGVGEENLVMRAVRLVRVESGIERGIGITLTKRIPAQAGLAGGSSDAAATLAGLNLWWDLGWSRERLAELGAQLGSDIPFFFHAPSAIARGRGEKVTPCRLGTTLHLVIVHPAQGLSTKEVFGRLQLPDRPASIAPIVSALEKGEVAEVARLLFNRLESVSVALSPAVAGIKAEAEQWKCLGHRMTGSGSAYFAICETSEQAQSLASSLAGRNLGSVFVVTSTS